MAGRLAITLSICVGAVAVAFATNAPARAGSEDCGRFEAINADGGSGVFETRAKGMTCNGARQVLAAFWRDGAGGATLGSTDDVKRFRCTYVSYYDPPNLALKCKHTRQQGKVAKAYWTPEEFEGG